MNRGALGAPRAWLGLWIVLMLCATYSAGWMFYAAMHQTTVGVQRPAGAGFTSPEGVEFRIVSMHQTKVIPGTYDPFESRPGATWVLVTFEATVPAPESMCSSHLVGRNGTTWDYSTDVYGRDRKFSCLDFEPGVPTLGEIIFEIPDTEVDHLLGLTAGYERDRFYRQLLLRPA